VANLSAKIFSSLTARVRVSTSICAISHATFSLASSSFRSANALVVESGFPGITLRADSCSVSAAGVIGLQSRTLFGHDSTKRRDGVSTNRSWLGSLLLVELRILCYGQVTLHSACLVPSTHPRRFVFQRVF
jgi:hypothetical protein